MNKILFSKLYIFTSVTAIEFDHVFILFVDKKKPTNN